MAVISRSGTWFEVTLDGLIIARFAHSLDAHRFVIGMLHDGMIEAATLLDGSNVVN